MNRLRRFEGRDVPSMTNPPLHQLRSIFPTPSFPPSIPFPSQHTDDRDARFDQMASTTTTFNVGMTCEGKYRHTHTLATQISRYDPAAVHSRHHMPSLQLSCRLLQCHQAYPGKDGRCVVVGREYARSAHALVKTLAGSDRPPSLPSSLPPSRPPFLPPSSLLKQSPCVPHSSGLCMRPRLSYLRLTTGYGPHPSLPPFIPPSLPSPPSLSRFFLQRHHLD